MSDVAAARALMANKAVTFRFAARLLPADSGDDVAVVYAFCRTVDDLADDHRDRAGLERMKAEIRGQLPASADTEGFLDVAGRRNIPLGAATDLIDGALSDLGAAVASSDAETIDGSGRPPVIIADDAALVRYGYAVAGTVGRMMAPLLGATGGHHAAVHLGVAMQLTNICRDVLEDARNGRVYLPAARLRAAGVEPETLLRGEADPARVARVVLDVLEMAEAWYASAEAGMWHLPARSRLAVLVAARTYRAIGRRLASNGGNALAGRTVLPWWSRVGALAAALLSLPFPRRIDHDHALDAPLVGLPGMA